MNKTIFRLAGTFLFLASMLSAERVGVIRDLMKVNTIAVDANNLYVTENTSVYIYELNKLTLLKKFGRKGEGPQEFKAPLFVMPLEKSLLINSEGKISYFSKQGRFQKEIKTGSGSGSALFFPVKQGYVARGFVREKKTTYMRINFYDSGLNIGKELYRVVSPSQSGGKIYLLAGNFIYRTHKDRIYIAAKPGFVIDVLEHNGKFLFSIKQDYDRRKVTGQDVKGIREALKLRYREQFELLKDRFAYPDFFPEISSMHIDQDLIYVLTWKQQNDKVECFIFDLNGNLKKQLYVHFAFEGAILPCTAYIKGGKLYQAVENNDEQWELHVSPIEDQNTTSNFKAESCASLSGTGMDSAHTGRATGKAKGT